MFLRDTTHGFSIYNEIIVIQ